MYICMYVVLATLLLKYELYRVLGLKKEHLDFLLKISLMQNKQYQKNI